MATKTIYSFIANQQTSHHISTEFAIDDNEVDYLERIYMECSMLLFPRYTTVFLKKLSTENPFYIHNVIGKKSVNTQAIKQFGI